MKQLFKICIFALTILLNACNSDEPSSSENNLSVIIKNDGSTNTGVSFIPIDSKSFYIDYVKYEIVDSHLEITGYDAKEISNNPKIYGEVTYNGFTYKTRTISEYAFKGSKIVSINLPNNIQTIERYAFEECCNLSDIILPKELCSMEGGAFSSCSSLTSVILPEKISTIEDYVFKNCIELTSISLPEKLSLIGNYAFMGCSNLSSITMPNDLKDIGEGAFYECKSLASIKLPNGITQIKPFSFFGCSALSSVSFPDNISTISNCAFEGCISLSSILIPNGVIAICYRAFYNCINLEDISFPESLEIIVGYSFGNCNAITKITCHSNQPPYFDYSIYTSFTSETIKNAIVYIPSGCTEKYLKSDWKYFSNIQEIQ